MSRANISKVSILGVGGMGLALAKSFLKSGYEVYGYGGDMDALKSAGGHPLGRVEEAARFDPVILVLPTDEALQEDSNALIPVLSEGQTIVSLGTQSLGAKTRVRDALAKGRVHFIEGELSGTSEMLSNSAASVMVHGDTAVLDWVTPLLQAAVKVVRLPAFGDPTRMKLIVNYLVAVHTLAAGEALVMAQALGLDLSVVVEAAANTAGASAMLAVRGLKMALGDYSGAGMSAFFHLFDDLRDCLHGEVADPPLLKLTEDTYRRTMDAGHQSQDLAAVFELLKAELLK